jgi:hypothetical protein
MIRSKKEKKRKAKRIHVETYCCLQSKVELVQQCHPYLASNIRCRIQTGSVYTMNCHPARRCIHSETSSSVGAAAVGCSNMHIKLINICYYKSDVMDYLKQPFA